MPEPFKNFFNRDMIKKVADHLHRAEKAFDKKRFVSLATKKLDALELKERSNQIRDALDATLPTDFRAACHTLVTSLHPESDIELAGLDMDKRGVRGWAIMPMADYVAQQGIDDFDFSMDVLKEMTKRFSAEFAIRAFFVADAKRALKHVTKWTKDPNFHVRRLASEGSRPRLPWGTRLSMFVDHPAPLLPILEKLKDDPTEYVRRSVANNLNDIAKDHPDVIAELAENWLKDAGRDRERLVRHACRTLIKQGHPGALKALGYSKPKVKLETFEIKTPNVAVGGQLEFSIELSSDKNRTQSLIIDYVIHHRKANGQTSPKVFKWKVVELPAGKSIHIKKKHSFKPITTRVYYPGTHRVDIQINGISYGNAEFELKSRND